MKKLIISISIFVVFAWGIGKLIKMSKPNVPEYDKAVIDSLYANKKIRNRLGKIKSFEFRYDSIAHDYSATKFTIAVEGNNRSSIWKGYAIKSSDKISILDLREVSD